MKDPHLDKASNSTFRYSDFLYLIPVLLLLAVFSAGILIAHMNVAKLAGAEQAQGPAPRSH